jgi:hypothetical protein
MFPREREIKTLDKRASEQRTLQLNISEVNEGVLTSNRDKLRTISPRDVCN